MQVQVNCGNGLEAKDSLERWATGFITESLGRFRAELTSVQMQLSDDAKGKNSGQDMRCTLEARLAAHQPLAVNHLAGTMDEAIRGAAQKLCNALEHTFGKLDRHQHRSRDTIRKDPEAVGPAGGPSDAA